jgi:uncharacterized protein (TIGR01777 family)
MKNVLITGATGLVGKHLTSALQIKNYHVAHLGRNKNPLPFIDGYTWDLNKMTIDDNALSKTNCIIHLAGANVGEGRWTPERKKEILDSRVLSTQLLKAALKKDNHHVDTFISASAIGYYGDTEDKLVNEKSPAGNDFLAHVVKTWEDETEEIESLGIRLIKLRIGVVFAKEGGALPKMAQPIKMFVGASLGSGNQFISWIHIEDLCQIFIHLLENDSLRGVYNAVAPHPVTNEMLTKIIAKVLHRPLILPNVPDFVLQAMLGEMSSIALTGSRVSSDKILQAGYQFKYVDAARAVRSLLKG